MSSGAGPEPEKSGLPAGVRQQIAERGAAALEGLIEPEIREEAALRVVDALHVRSETVSELEFTATQHAGPVPAPATMEHYDRILPGSADRMLAMAERDQGAYIQSNSRKQWLDFSFKSLCVVLGVVGLFAILAAVIYLAINGHDGVAGTVITALGVGTVAAIVNARMGKGSAGS